MPAIDGKQSELVEVYAQDPIISVTTERVRRDLAAASSWSELPLGLKFLSNRFLHHLSVADMERLSQAINYK